MRIGLKIALLSGILFSFSAYAVEQKDIVLDGDMDAMLTTPSKGTAITGKVLIIHGWTSNMYGVGDIFKPLAEQLAEQGIASLSISCRGEWDQREKGKALTSTMASRVYDTDVGFDYLNTLYPDVPSGILGHSLGGLTTMYYVGDNPEAFDSVVLWSPTNRSTRITEGIGDDAVKTALAKGESRFVAPWGDEMKVSREHVLGMLGYTKAVDLEKYTGALLIYSGSADFNIEKDTEILEMASGSPEEYRWLVGATHIYDVFKPESDAEDRINADTVNWFVYSLK